MTNPAPGVAIGIDLGTSGLRAALVDAAGAMVAFAAVPIQPDRRRKPPAWWAATCVAVRDLGASASLAEVRALAVDGTSGTVLPVDAMGAPCMDASLYHEPAAADAVARIAAIAPRDSAARGAASPLAKILAWRGRPGVARMLHEADWLAGTLRGVFGASDWNNALKTGFDPRTLAWPPWLAALDLDPALLPTPFEPGAPLGPISTAVARRLGLPAEAIIAAGTTDGCAAFLATGADQIGDGVTSLGTTLTLKLLSTSPIFAPEYGIYSHRIGARWLAGGASNSGGAALARHFDRETVDRLSRAIDPATRSGCDYYPLATSGERFPVANASLASRHTPRPADDAAFLHGLLEGIADIEALGYQRLHTLGGERLRAVFSVGGGARNQTWTAIRARLLGVPVRQPRAQQAAVGTARLALQAAGYSPVLWIDSK